jgi:hypothetical protein
MASRALAAGKTGTPVPCAGARCLDFGADVRAAFLHALAGKPAIVGLGEYHRTNADVRVETSMKRFTRDLFPHAYARSSDIVVETWITDGRCGEAERQVTAQIAERIDRPAEVEDEVVTLVKQALANKVEPHVIKLSCREWEALQGEGGQVDDGELLVLVQRKLQGLAMELHRRQASAKRPRRVLVYGGALHNDLAPAPELAEYAFGPQLARATKGRYVELDLIVPELVPDDDDLRRQPWWRLVAQGRGGVPHAWLVSPGRGRFTLVFPWTSP